MSDRKEKLGSKLEEFSRNSTLGNGGTTPEKKKLNLFFLISQN